MHLCFWGRHLGSIQCVLQCVFPVSLLCLSSGEFKRPAPRRWLQLVSLKQECLFFTVTLLAKEEHGERIIGLQIARIQRDCLTQAFFSWLCFSELKVCRAHQCESLGIVCKQRNGALKRLDSFPRLLFLIQEFHAALELFPRIVRNPKASFGNCA